MLMNDETIRGDVEKAFFLGNAGKRGNESQLFAVFMLKKKMKKKLRMQDLKV